MSETSQGPGWWVASDGKWYPPEQHPDAAAAPPPTPAEPAPPVVPPADPVPPAPDPQPAPTAAEPSAPLPAPEPADRPLPPGATQVIQRPIVPPAPGPEPTPAPVVAEPTPPGFAPPVAGAPPAQPPPGPPSFPPSGAAPSGPGAPVPGAPIPGGSFSPAEPPAKKGGAGKIILILVALVVLIVIVGAVIAFLASRNSTPSAADVATATGIRSANTSGANPPQYDLNLPKDGGGGSLSCTSAGGQLVSASTLTNKSGVPSDYDVVVEFRQDGKTVGSATAKVTNVASGATTDWTAKTAADINGQFSCKVVEVDRRQAGSQTLN